MSQIRSYLNTWPSYSVTKFQSQSTRCRPIRLFLWRKWKSSWDILHLCRWPSHNIVIGRHLSDSDTCPTATSVCQRHLSDSRIRDFGQISLSDRNRFLRHPSDYICKFGSHSYVRSLRVILWHCLYKYQLASNSSNHVSGTVLNRNQIEISDNCRYHNFEVHLTPGLNT